MMKAIQVIWLIGTTAVVGILASLVTVNLICRALRLRGRPLGDGGPLVIMGILLLLSACMAVMIAARSSTSIAIVVMCTIALTAGLFHYFLNQRFADRMLRTDMSLMKPAFSPSVALVCFVSSVTAFLIYTPWYFASIPFLIYIIIGFLTAELAIRRYIRLSKEHGKDADREFAIYMVNDAQGRRFMLGPNRYPFP